MRMRLAKKTALIIGGNIAFATARLFKVEGADVVITGRNQSIPLGHFGEADDIAKTVLFLAVDDAAHIHAAEIVVDGGHTGAPSGAPIFRAPRAPSIVKADHHG
jgi:NAD(P)-dependent dehydrogenase (short-subunit alcohol dehydrogenase family)